MGVELKKIIMIYTKKEQEKLNMLCIIYMSTEHLWWLYERHWRCEVTAALLQGFSVLAVSDALVFNSASLAWGGGINPLRAASCFNSLCP